MLNIFATFDVFMLQHIVCAEWNIEYFYLKTLELLVPKCERFAILILLNLSIERNEDVHADKNGNKNNKNCEWIGTLFDCGQK